MELDKKTIYVIAGVAGLGAIVYLVIQAKKLLTSANDVGNKINRGEATGIAPIDMVQNAAYSTGSGFWGWYDSVFTEPALRKEQQDQTERDAIASGAAMFRESGGDVSYDPALYALGISPKKADSRIF